MKNFSEISSKWVAEAQEYLKTLEADYLSSRAQLEADYRSSRAEAVQWLEACKARGTSKSSALMPSASFLPQNGAPVQHIRKMLPIDAITETAPLLQTFTFAELLGEIHSRYGAKDFPKESVRGAFRRWIDRGDCPFTKLPKADRNDPAELNRYGMRPDTMEMNLLAVNGRKKAGTT